MGWLAAVLTVGAVFRVVFGEAIVRNGKEGREERGGRGGKRYERREGRGASFGRILRIPRY